MSNKRMDSVRLVWLEAFVAAADAGSFTAAGKKVGCHRTKASRYVEKLETWLGGMSLMHNGTTELTLTGEKFLPTARKVVRVLTEAHAALALKQVSADSVPEEQSRCNRTDPKGLKI